MLTPFTKMRQRTTSGYYARGNDWATTERDLLGSGASSASDFIQSLRHWRCKRESASTRGKRAEQQRERVEMKLKLYMCIWTKAAPRRSIRKGYSFSRFYLMRFEVTQKIKESRKIF